MPEKLKQKLFDIEYTHEKSDDGFDYITGRANTKNKEDRVGDIPASYEDKPVYDLKLFKKNPVALIDHSMSVGNIAGSFVKLKETDQGLDFKLKFMKEPQTDITKHAKQAYIEGHGRAFSIGYRGFYEDDKHPNHLTKIVLHEISLVSVGADPLALSDVPKPKALGEAKSDKLDALTMAISKCRVDPSKENFENVEKIKKGEN